MAVVVSAQVAAIAIGASPISGGTTGRIIYNNAGVAGETSAITTNGTGALTIGTQQTTRGTLILANTAAGAFPVTLQASNSTTAAYTLTLPVDDGTSNQVLTTDGAGVLSWATAASGLTVGTTAIASGTTTRILYDNAGVLGEYTISGSGTEVLMSTAPVLAAGTTLSWSGRSKISSPADGTVLLTDTAGTAFTNLHLGGTTSSFPMIQRSSATIRFRLSDNSDDAAITAANITSSSYIEAGGGSRLGWGSSSRMTAPSNGIIQMTNAAANDFTRLNFGGATSSFPALKRSTTTLQVRLADDSAYGGLTALAYTSDTPNGGTAGAWKLGIRVAATVALDTTQYIQLDIGGTLYKVGIVA